MRVQCSLVPSTHLRLHPSPTAENESLAIRRGILNSMYSTTPMCKLYIFVSLQFEDAACDCARVYAKTPFSSSSDNDPCITSHHSIFRATFSDTAGGIRVCSILLNSLFRPFLSAKTKLFVQFHSILLMPVCTCRIDWFVLSVSTQHVCAVWASLYFYTPTQYAL